VSFTQVAQAAQADICAQAVAAETARDALAKEEDAKAYLGLVFLAAKARTARLALERAQASAHAVPNDTADSANTRDDVTAAKASVDALLVNPQPDANQVDEKDAEDVAAVTAVHAAAKSAAPESHRAYEKTLELLDGPGLGRTGEALSDLGKGLEETEGVPRDITKVNALPVPNSCTDADAYNGHLTALVNHNETLTDCIRPVVEARQALAGRRTRVESEMTTKRATLGQPGGLQTQVNAVRENNVKNRDAPRVNTWNNFSDDCEASNKLMNDAAALANAADTMADLAQVDLATLDTPATALAVSTNALIARLQNIENAATAASKLIPYDSKGSSQSAVAALDAGDAAAKALEMLQATKAAQEIQLKKLPKAALRVRRAISAARKQGYLSAAISRCTGGYYDPTDYYGATTAQKALKDLKQELEDTQATLDHAEQCAQRAAQAADQAAGLRMKHLMAEGHGPQRHGPDVSKEQLQERCVFRIDPETRTQLDVDGGIHKADPRASKFTSKATYVRADSMARAHPNMGDNGTLVRLDQIDADISNLVEGYECNNRPEGVETSMGKTTQVPTRGDYLYSAQRGPPNRQQMDVNRLKQDAERLSAKKTYPNDTSAKAILRADINGKLYLRTMWPEEP